MHMTSAAGSCAVFALLIAALCGVQGAGPAVRLCAAIVAVALALAAVVLVFVDVRRRDGAGRSRVRRN